MRHNKLEVYYAIEALIKEKELNVGAAEVLTDFALTLPDVRKKAKIQKKKAEDDALGYAYEAGRYDSGAANDEEAYEGVGHFRICRRGTVVEIVDNRDSGTESFSGHCFLAFNPERSRYVFGEYEKKACRSFFLDLFSFFYFVFSFGVQYLDYRIHKYVPVITKEWNAGH